MKSLILRGTFGEGSWDDQESDEEMEEEEEDEDEEEEDPVQNCVFPAAAIPGEGVGVEPLPHRPSVSAPIAPLEPQGVFGPAPPVQPGPEAPEKGKISEAIASEFVGGTLTQKPPP